MDKPRRCTAKSKQSGERCKRAPIQGGAVCTMHGGKAPQVIKSARDRLRDLVDPAITTLARALEGTDQRLALRACQEVLDRAGFPRALGVREDVASRPTVIQVVTGVPRPAPEVVSDGKGAYAREWRVRNTSELNQLLQLR